MNLLYYRLAPVVFWSHAPSWVRALLLVTLISCYIVIFPSYAISCSCIEQTLEERYDHSKNVFIARITSVYESPDLKHPLRVKFEAINNLKEDHPLPVELKTGFGGGDCGAEFLVGWTYIVFALEDSIVGRCTGVWRYIKGHKSQEELLKKIREIGGGKNRSSRGNGIAPATPPTPPDMRSSASGD